MILVTGAAGKTGRAVLKALLNRNADVRVLVRRSEQAEELKETGAADTIVGDMTTAESYRRAMDGVKAVYHICPNMHPLEIEIGRLAITAALEGGLDHFVYHSVLHPQTEKMPHHWQKMRVEEMLFESGLDFTIFQPAPYMQNILAGREKIISEGVYRVPYPVGTHLSLVDVEDLGEAAAIVLTEPGHGSATYEIVGTEALSQVETAAVIGKVLARHVAAEETAPARWRKAAENTGINSYALETLQKMFEYYARYGLKGNSNVLRLLLGREPFRLVDFVSREFINRS